MRCPDTGFSCLLLRGTPMKPDTILRHVLERIRSAADTFADKRQGPNLRYTLADAVLSAFACFFLQSPSFLAFQRRMQHRQSRSNCQTLFGMQGIPSDGQIRKPVGQTGSRLFSELVSAPVGYASVQGGFCAVCTSCRSHARGAGRHRVSFLPDDPLSAMLRAQDGKGQASRILPYHVGGGSGGSGP